MFQGKRVYIVGGSKGIGKAAAIQLARQGASVAIGARGRAELDATLAELRSAGSGTMVAVEVDVTDTASVNRAAAEAIAGLGGIDVLVCCSGYAECDAVLDMDEERIRRVMDTNYMGHVRNVKAVGPHLVRQKSGHICLVTSMAAITGFWGYGPYGASKAAIVQMAEALRQEMKQHGVGVSVFLPPTTDTPGLAHENEHKPDVLYVVESESTFNKTHPPDEIARHMLDGIARNQFYKIATMDSWIQYVIVRKLTGLYHYLADGELQTGMKKVADRKAKGLNPKTGQPIE